MSKINEYSSKKGIEYANSKDNLYTNDLEAFVTGFDAAMDLQLPVKIKLINALRHLVILKKHKDKYGKTVSYSEQQPKAWDYAIEVLKEIDPEDEFQV